MLTNLEALAALADAGTMTRAATRLRVTQSAVSKRIAALQDELGITLLERDGRRVRLTAAAHRILERATPLLSELRHALADERAIGGGSLAIGVSESVLTSWGPAALARATRALPGLELTIGAHRSPVAVDRVRAGEYIVALCAGAPDLGGDLTHVPITDEQLVLVPSALGPLRPRAGARIDVLTIERGSATWRALEPALATLRRERRIDIHVARTVQSFACVVQLARAGFGHGLVPRPLARALGVPSRALVPLPRPGLTRPIIAVARPRTLARPLVSAFVAQLAAAAPGRAA